MIENIDEFCKLAAGLDPVPEGLECMEQDLFQRLRNTYYLYRRGNGIPEAIEKGTTEKERLLRGYERLLSIETNRTMLNAAHAETIKKTENCRTRIRKANTNEERAALALELVGIIDGII